MSLISTRVHAASVAHRYLQRCLANFDTNCARLTARLHQRYDLTSVPAPSITDAVAALCDGDDVMAAQMFGGDLDVEIENELASEIAKQFGRYREDFTPSEKAIAKIVGTKLARVAYPLLSLVDLLAIVRTPSDAKHLCERRVASKKQSMSLSVATL